ncbi:MAG: glycosyltransferase family 9 protein [Deltaproteobacteria bacterium]
MNLRIARYIDRWVGLGVCFLLWMLGRLLGSVPPLRATTPPDGASPVRVPRRLLAIKFYGLGNIAMITPTLAAMRGDGEVEIDFLTLPGNRGLLEQSGLVTRMLTVEVDGFVSFLRSVGRLLSGLRSGYDAVLDFEQFMKLSGIFAFLTGASARVGFNTEGQSRGWLYTHRVAYADTDHMADIFMRLAVPFDRAELPAPRIRIPTREEDRRQLLEKLPAGMGDSLILMHVGTGPNYDKIALKRWPPERFGALADHLVETRGAHIVFTGVGAEESGLVELARAKMRHAHASTNVCDALTLGELISLLDACPFVVTNDTSILHLAGLVHTPVVAFFGPTEPRLYGPRGEDDLVFYESLYCSPCLSNYNLKMSRCVNPVCMQRIGLVSVITRIDEHFPPHADGKAVSSASVRES